MKNNFIKGKKRILAAIFAMCMVFSCTAVVFADSASNDADKSKEYRSWYYANFYGSEGITYYGIPHAYWQDSKDFVVEYEGETYTYTYENGKIIFEGKELSDCTGMIVAGVDGNIYLENSKGWLMSGKIGSSETVEFAGNKIVYMNFINGDYETYVIYAYAVVDAPRTIL